MILQSLVLKNFRNHRSTALEFPAQFNAFIGDNGQGKTSILEAIAYLCLTKSFTAQNDITVVTLGEEEFHVAGEFRSDLGAPSSVEIRYRRAEGKKTLQMNRTPVDSFASFIGIHPAVVLASDHEQITLGLPSARRRFLDVLLSQARRSYLEDLVAYRRTLRNRNRILFDMRERRSVGTELLEPWDEQLSTIGARIIDRRLRFLTEFQPYVEDSYRQIAEGGEHPALRYAPSICVAEGAPREEIQDAFRSKLRDGLYRDTALGRTGAGPHLDELVFLLNDLEVRQYASRGQHKTFLVALKVAEFVYLRERLQETPIVLFDDVIVELDDRRSKALIDTVCSLGQAFVTATDGRFLEKLPARVEMKEFEIVNGGIKARTVEPEADRERA
ncbi:MAG: DNA replication and repair protein RecF [Ignavibacteriales bacterium CG07_land_8_20_14_0_80_59_12]|nr:MAG: DNA replication and repair protein RecF [Ignavibacteriales bacterium CG07_land_8_20_14_0_80_59_12]